MWSRQTERKKVQTPKSASATHADYERALQAWTKWQRAEIIPKSTANRSREVQVRAAQLQNAFHRLTPELSRADRSGCEPVLPAWP